MSSHQGSELHCTSGVDAVGRGRVTYQVIGYEEGAEDVPPRAEPIMFLKTSEENMARFLANQLLMRQFARCDPADKELIGYSVEIRRGRRFGPLDTGLWVPNCQDAVADIAYLDTETGSVEWQANAPTYVVVSEQQRDVEVVELSDRRR
jgi:hypothetical protein